MGTQHCHCGEGNCEMDVGREWVCPVVQVRMNGGTLDKLWAFSAHMQAG